MASLLIPGNIVDISVVITSPGAVSNLGVQASATKAFVVVRAFIELAQATVPADAHCRLRLVKKTAAPTYTAIAAASWFNKDPVEPDPSFTAGHTASGEGTDGDFIERGWGSRTGWTFDWNPTPEEYIIIPAGVANGFALKHNVPPPAGNYAFTLSVGEIG
jgi:hypothetical protein